MFTTFTADKYINMKRTAENYGRCQVGVALKSNKIKHCIHF